MVSSLYNINKSSDFLITWRRSRRRKRRKYGRSRFLWEENWNRDELRLVVYVQWTENRTSRFVTLHPNEGNARAV